MTNLSNVLVYGWDNGGAELVCLVCEDVIGGGGCACCDGNQVTLADLVQASRDHLCKEKPSV